MRKVPLELGGLVFSTHQSGQFRKALPVKVSHRFAASSAVFDDERLVSCAGLVPVMALAEQTGLSSSLADKVRFSCERVKSGAANPSPKLTTLITAMGIARALELLAPSLE